MATTTIPVTSASGRHLAEMAAEATSGPAWTTVARGEIGTLPWCRLRRVVEYIEVHLDQAPTLAQLGAVAGMSPYHFARLFRRSTGMPPHRFVVRKRIASAITLLAASDLSVARIARTVGFRTPSHFTTVFRRVTGISPSAYRASQVREDVRSRQAGRDENALTQ
jgi:AraC family transcriptional regulator